MKECPNCGRSIRDRARYCQHCDGFIDARILPISAQECPYCATHVDEHLASRCLDAWVWEAMGGTPLWEMMDGQAHPNYPQEKFFYRKFSKSLVPIPNPSSNMNDAWYIASTFRGGDSELDKKFLAELVSYLSSVSPKFSEFPEAIFSLHPILICRAVIKSSAEHPAEKALQHHSKHVMSSTSGEYQLFDSALKIMSQFRDYFGRKLDESTIAELYASREFGADFTERINEPGYDLVDHKGRKYQVKYRATSTNNMDINNFDFDFLVLINMDDAYSLEGIWKLDVYTTKEIFIEREDFRKFQCTQKKFKEKAERIR